MRAQLQAAWTALNAGRPADTLALLAPLLADQPHLVDALQLQAGAALQLGQPGLAVQALRAAVMQAPEQAGLHYNLAVAEQAAGNPAAALAAFRNCLVRQPEHGEAQRGLVLALLDAGHGEEAERLARVAAGAAGFDSPATRTLALVQERRGRIDDALATLTGPAADPAAAFAQALARGHLALRHGRLAVAADAFAAAAAARPASAEAWNNLAACQSLLDRVDDAVHSARQAVALEPTARGSRLTLAAALSRSRERVQLDESLTLCRRLLDGAPEAAAADCAAIVLAKLGLPDQAEPFARTAVAADPDQVGYAVTLARVLEQLDDVAGAEAALAGARATAADPVLLRQAGHLHLRQGRATQALAALDQAFHLDPSHQGGIAERAIALGLAQGWPAAEEWLDLHQQVRPVALAVPRGFAGCAPFLAALADDIREHSQLRFEPMGLAARGGYLTGDLLADATPAITGFAESLRQAIAGFVSGLPDQPGHPFLGQVPRGEHLLHIWATRVSEQGVIDTHLHEGSWLSGAFYVELPPAIGEDDGAGWIEFGQPYAGLPGPPPERLLRLRPAPGLLLLFPSYLFHRTLPYRGEGERISISFDLGPR